MKVINHPNYFKQGTRVILLNGRNKDGAKPRTVRTYTNTETEWDAIVDATVPLALEGERIYASLAARSIDKAVRKFKEMQLNADYIPNSTFYHRINDRFISALATPTSAEEKLWLLDIDSPKTYDVVADQMEEQDVPSLYSYQTKNGIHIVVKPFNRSKWSLEAQATIKPDGMILVGY